MGDSYLSNEALELINYLSNTEENEVAVEASASRINQYSDTLKNTDFTYGPRMFATHRLWSIYRANWKSVRREYMKASMRDNIDEQKSALIKEREMILETIKAVDTIPENAVTNIAFMVGITALTIGLTGLVLSIPTSVAVVDAGKNAFLAAGGTASAFATHTMNATASKVVTVAATVSQATMALKMIGLSAKYTDPTNSVLRSQKATGVMSKQLLVLRLNRALASLDKKLKYVMAKQLLVTNQYALDALEKYSDRYLENFVTQTTKMNERMNDTAIKWADEATFNSNKQSKKDTTNNDKKDQKGKGQKGKGNSKTISESIDTLIKEIS